MPEKLILQPTATSHWKALLQDAEQKCNCSLDEEVESYLIFTLIRFTQNPHLASAALAPDYLKSQHLGGHAQQLQLRDVGDQCLLLSGLFPQRAEKRLVRVSYYVDLGRSAYDHLSQILRQAMADLYRHLAHHFVQLMDVLQNLRAEPALQPLQALELWADTGSHNAYGIVTSSTGSIPLNTAQSKPH